MASIVHTSDVLSGITDGASDAVNCPVFVLPLLGQQRQDGLRNGQQNMMDEIDGSQADETVRFRTRWRSVRARLPEGARRRATSLVGALRENRTQDWQQEEWPAPGSAAINQDRAGRRSETRRRTRHPRYRIVAESRLRSRRRTTRHAGGRK